MTGLEATLGVRRESFALNLAIDLPPATTVVLLGPNGAGKSTAVALLAGLLRLDSGQIRLDGQTFDDPVSGRFVPAEQRRVGVMFQDGVLFPHLTASRNIAFGVRDRSKRAATAAEWLSRVGLDGFGDRLPHELSGGQAQRVALARTLAADPRVLLLDEPLSALDVATRAETRRVLATHLLDFPGPRLVITHDPAEAFHFADRIDIVENGRLTQSGSVDDIRLRPTTSYAAEVAGTNLARGVAADGYVDVGGHMLQIADRSHAGAVVVSIRPSSVAVHADRPQGSPRNVWQTQVTLMETSGDRVRLRTGGPLPLNVEITLESARHLGLSRGTTVWASVKATDIEVEAG